MHEVVGQGPEVVEAGLLLAVLKANDLLCRNSNRLCQFRLGLTDLLSQRLESFFKFHGIHLLTCTNQSIILIMV